MKHIKKFNESNKFSDYEIVDYFTDLEDDGIVSIILIEDVFKNVNENHKKSLINRCFGIIDGPAYDTEGTIHGLLEYLNYFSIKNLKEYLEFESSDSYIPLMEMRLRYLIGDLDRNGLNNFAIQKSNESIERCKEVSNRTKIFDFINNWSEFGNILFIQE